MKIWQELYGSDIDGNRGVMQTFWELDGSEEEQEDIAEILHSEGVGSSEMGRHNIEYLEMDIDVYIEDYSEEIAYLETRDEIEEIADMPFDKIAMIFNTSKDQYLPTAKDVGKILKDLKDNGYIACPF